jgi:triphosphatase
MRPMSTLRRFYSDNSDNNDQSAVAERLVLVRDANLKAETRFTARKAKRIRLKKVASVDRTIPVIFGECLKHWLANESMALVGAGPEGIHEMRVGLRRMRSAISAFRTILAPSQLAWMKRETGWLVRNLGPARDWDVFLSELLAPIEAARAHERGLAKLRAAALAERDRAYVTARNAIRSSRHLKFVVSIRRWLSGREWRNGSQQSLKRLERPVLGFARRVLNKRHRAIVNRGRDFTSLTGQERHQLRIALKKLRYTAEFFRSLYPKNVAEPYFGALAEMQDCLGHMNDVVVAEHLLDRLAAARQRQRALDNLPSAIGMVVGWHAYGAKASEREVEENWQKFCAAGRFW